MRRVAVPIVVLLALLGLSCSVSEDDRSAVTTATADPEPMRTAGLPWRQTPYRPHASVTRPPEDRPPLVPELPPSARQTHEGYWLGAMLRPEDVPTLVDLGIRVVLSAEEPSWETLQGLAAHGIEQVSIPMSDRFLHGETILDVADRYDESQIFIHCQYGADRTGVIAAFLLVMRQGWIIPDALYSVLYQSQEHAAGLADLLARYDMPDYRPFDDPSVGFYSVAAAGGSGGLKTNTRGGIRLVSSMLDAIEEIETRRSGRERLSWDGSID